MRRLMPAAMVFWALTANVDPARSKGSDDLRSNVVATGHAGNLLGWFQEELPKLRAKINELKFADLRPNMDYVRQQIADTPFSAVWDTLIDTPAPVVFSQMASFIVDYLPDDDELNGYIASTPPQFAEFAVGAKWVKSFLALELAHLASSGREADSIVAMVTEVKSKIPRYFGDGMLADSNNGGWKWSFGKADSIRLDYGNPKSTLPAQREAYIKITSDGKVIGKGGAVYPDGNDRDAHVPLSTWLTWRSWNSP